MQELTTQRKRCTIALAQAVGRTLRGIQPPFKIYIIIMVNYLYLFYISSQKKKFSCS